MGGLVPRDERPDILPGPPVSIGSWIPRKTLIFGAILRHPKQGALVGYKWLTITSFCVLRSIPSHLQPVVFILLC